MARASIGHNLPCQDIRKIVGYIKRLSNCTKVRNLSQFRKVGLDDKKRSMSRLYLNRRFRTLL